MTDAPGSWLHVFFAIGSFQLLFIASLAIGSRRKDYAVYTAYLLSVLIYSVGICENYYRLNLLPVGFPLAHLVLDKPMVFFSYMLYFRFGRRFLDTEKIDARFDALVRKFEWILLSFTFIQVLVLAWASPGTAELVFQALCLVVIPISLYSVVRFIRLQRSRLNYFFITGVTAILLGSLGTFTAIPLQLRGILDEKFPAPVIFQVSVLVESFVFSLGLIYKLVYAEKEKNMLQQKFFEELQAKYDMQRRLKEYTSELSQNLHDHIGASFTNISLLSRIPGERAELANVQRNNTLIEKIATESITELKETVWLIRQEHESLDRIIGKLKDQYTLPLAGKGMELQITRSEKLQDHALNVIQLRHVFLIAKEALTNSLKYSNGSRAEVHFDRLDSVFQLKLADNGTCGKDVNLFLEKGNGLRHLHERVKQLQGTIRLLNPEQFIFNISFEIYAPKENQRI